MYLENRKWNRWSWTAIALGALLLVWAGCSTPGDAEVEQPDDEMEKVEESDQPAGEQEDDHREEHRDRHDHHEEHADHHDHSFDDPERYAEHWNDPERDDWQRPQAVVEAMDIEDGMAVADIGAGTGYFIPYLSDAVGDEGTVYAVDIEESMLEYIDEMADEAELDNVETVLAEAEDSGLDEESVDRILTVNTWHHIPNRGEYSGHLLERLTDGGSVWVVDYHEDSPTGPPPEHRLDPEVVIGELEEGGLDAEIVDIELERQYVVVGR